MPHEIPDTPNPPERPARRDWSAPLFAVLTTVFLVCATALFAVPALGDPPEDGLAGSTLYVNPDSSTSRAGEELEGQELADNQLLASLPSATWLTHGTPAEMTQQVDGIVSDAAERGEMPVLVAYNLPFRDCAQYSAGGATGTEEYEEWIDAIAEGIGDRPATVIVEPDGLGIIPHYTNLAGELEWCQPEEADPAAAADDRFEQLNHAVDAFAALDSTAVYLDGTGPAWINVGDQADRLVKAGVQKADGFFLNVSNYQYTENTTFYGTWVSSCIAYATDLQPGDFAACPDQDSYAELLGDTEPAAHFVVDTSRNGQGPWQYPDTYGDQHEDWCNPPDRGLGARPATEVDDPLVDAYLWIKVPGESDGKCYRGTEGPEDPERGMEDPDAGGWFPEQAAELIALADPPLETDPVDPEPTDEPTSTEPTQEPSSTDPTTAEETTDAPATATTDDPSGSASADTTAGAEELAATGTDAAVPAFVAAVLIGTGIAFRVGTRLRG
jgi:endoglucanase